ncbi:hypothetical protein [Bernardetia sp. MNP-M8]|uniref:hypothetical protein n=1 Tax=Bernardetia sp. MNP-M8 TaxID=3127470 RepID=UPI0030CCF1A7
MTKKYFEQEFSATSTLFQNSFSELDISNVDESDTLLFEKMQTVFFLGQLLGLPTLKSILVKFGITSSQVSINYKKLYKKLTINKIRVLYEYVFKTQVVHLLKEMASKDSSIWSKKRVTAVLDDSIFRQWLSELGRENDYFGSFFSGQYRATTLGFKVVCFGLYIEDVFYPLFFDFVRKKGKADKKEPIQIAKKLVNRWGKLQEKLAKENSVLPSIHFSCDSGYSDVSLSEECTNQSTSLIYISVPKKNHIIIVNNKKTNSKEYIDRVFLEKEKKHQEAQRHLKEEEKTPFTLRLKAFYQCQKREVVLLFFRLNGSKKVSVIYTPNLTVFAKTLRRHWFNRTYIEQFFKTLKHVLKISEPRTKNKEEFENKLLKFAFLAIEVQKIVRFIRRKCKQFKQKGFISLQRILCSNKEILDLLQKQINIKT